MVMRVNGHSRVWIVELLNLIVDKITRSLWTGAESRILTITETRYL